MRLLFILLIPVPIFLLWALLIRPRSSNADIKPLLKYDYAHRGYHCKPHIPENSIPAFQRALENGFAAELDVHLTLDGQLAVIHDSDLMRVTGQHGTVENMTFSQLCSLRLEGTEYTIPRLEQVLELFAGRAPLLIELKAHNKNYEDLCRAVSNVLDNYTGDFCLESFYPQVLLWLKRNRPEWVRGQLVCDLRKAGEQRSRMENFLFKNLLINAITCPDFIAYRISERSNPSLRLCRRLYRAVEFSWTVQTRAQQQAVKKDGCIIIFEQFDPRMTQNHSSESRR